MPICAELLHIHVNTTIGMFRESDMKLRYAHNISVVDMLSLFIYLLHNFQREQRKLS